MGKHKSRNGKGKKQQNPSRTSDKNASAPSPTGSALEVSLLAGPDFQEAVHATANPASVLDTTPKAEGQRLSLENWSQVEALVEWFKIGSAGSNTCAQMTFSPLLGQDYRAILHSLAKKHDLQSMSEGVGEHRHIILYAKGHAPAKSPINDDLAKHAKLLYLLAKADNINVSRDELAEMFAINSLPSNLKQLWDTKGAEQLALVKLNQAASRGKLDDLKAAIEVHPELVKSGKYEVVSTLTPLSCAAAQGHTECLQALMQAGAPLEAVDGFGLTPLQVSRKFEQMDTEALLLRVGANDRSADTDFGTAISMNSSQDLDARAEASEQADPAKRGSFSLENALHAKPFVPKNGHKDAEEDLKRSISSTRQDEASPTCKTSDAIAEEQDLPSADSGNTRTEAASKEAACASGDAVSKQATAGSSGGADEAREEKTDKPKPSPAQLRSSFESSEGPPIREPATTQRQLPKSAQRQSNTAAEETSELRHNSGGYTEASQPPVVPGRISRKVPAVVGGRSLTSQVPQGMLKEYNAPPNLRGDPRTATRGQPGASAVALGRRIIENAAVEMNRYGSAGQSGDLDKFPYLEPSQPPTFKAGKLADVPNVVGGRGVVATDAAEDKIQVSKPVRPGPRTNRERRDNKHRVEQWMESAPEEHSSNPSHPSKSSTPSNPSNPSNPTTQQSGSSKIPSSSSNNAETAPSQPLRATDTAEAKAASGDAELLQDNETAAEAGRAAENGELTAPETAADKVTGLGKKEPGADHGKEGELKYQDPRGPTEPSQPPVALGAPRPAVESDIPGQPGVATNLQRQTLRPIDEPSQQPASSPDEEATRPSADEIAAKANDIDTSVPNTQPTSSNPTPSKEADVDPARAPYTEGTQPPSVAQCSISQVPAVVGGRSLVSEPNSNAQELKNANISNNSRTATYGQRRPTKATSIGRHIIEDPAVKSETHGFSGRPGALNRLPYVEPSQPLAGPGGKLEGIQNVVGGRSVEKPSEASTVEAPSSQPQSQPTGKDISPNAAPPARNAALDSPASVQGEAISAVASSPQDDALAAAQQDMVGMAAPLLGNAAPAMGRISEEVVLQASEESARPPSFEFVKRPTLSPEGASAVAEGLLGSSSTAAMFGRPKGLGATQGLPQKRPGSGKPGVKSKAKDQSAASSSSGVSSSSSSNPPASGNIFSALKQTTAAVIEKLSPAVRSPPPEANASSAGQPWGQWAKENKYVIAGGIAAGAAAAAGFWMTLRRK